MATPPPFSSHSTALDTNYLSRVAAVQLSQIASLAVPPLYLIANIYRRQPFLFNRFLRATWIGTAAGAAVGGGIELVRLQGRTPTQVGEKAWVVGHDANRIRSTDFSTIGAVLGGVLTSAILWKRAKKVHLILGGAALGEAAGYAAHLYQSWMVGDIVPAAVRRAEANASATAVRNEAAASPVVPVAEPVSVVQKEPVVVQK